ncbi:hypothetical protein D3C76_1514430 [compost metagenome]
MKFAATRDRRQQSKRKNRTRCIIERRFALHRLADTHLDLHLFEDRDDRCRVRRSNDRSCEEGKNPIHPEQKMHACPHNQYGDDYPGNAKQG